MVSRMHLVGVTNVAFVSIDFFIYFYYKAFCLCHIKQLIQFQPRGSSITSFNTTTILLYLEQ